MVTDSFVRNVLAPALLLIFFGLLSPAFLAAGVIVTTDFFTAAEPRSALWIVEQFQNFDGLPSDLTAFLLQVFPALIGAICYRKTDVLTLNWVGRIALVMLAIGALVSFAVVLFISPENKDQIDAVTGGKDALKLLKSGSEASLRVAITYILLFAGLQVNVVETKKT